MVHIHHKVLRSLRADIRDFKHFDNSLFLSCLEWKINETVNQARIS